MSETKVITGKVRFSYAHVFEKHSIEGAEGKYGVVLLIPKTATDTIRKIEAAVDAAIEVGKTKLDLKGKDARKVKNFKLPLRDGDEEDDKGDEYRGMYFVSANSSTKPGVVDLDREPILDQEDFYSGCYGRASINFFAFNTNGNKGIACGLNNLQKLADGERFGGGSKAEDDFADDLDEDDDMM